MRKFAVAAFAACLCPAAAAAAPHAALTSASPPAAQAVRVAMRQETLPPGGRLPEHRSDGERYLYVVSGQLKLSNLVTGDEQIIAAGRMAAEQPGDWHVAEALGQEPATFYLIDRGPAGGN